MTAVQFQSRLTFEQFLDYDDGTARFFELLDGIPVAMPEPAERHEEIIRFLDAQCQAAIATARFDWTPRQRRLIQIPVGGYANGRRPDLIIINQPRSPQAQEDRAAYQPPHFIFEVASGNWSDDLKKKVRDYALLQVPEYWVIDYRGQIPEKDCDRGKGIKTIVFRLDGYRYKRQEYLGDEAIECIVLPSLSLTTNAIIAANG